MVETETRTGILTQMLTLLDQYYVFPAVAAQIRQTVEENLSNGAYDDVASLDELCERVTAQMQEISHDKHLRLRRRLSGAGTGRLSAGMTAEAMADYRRRQAHQNYGFAKVERLAGNVGYLDLRMLDLPDIAGETAVAAMNYLGNSSALIIDLRECRGGTPGMVALLCSYLFGPAPVHLNSLYNRVSDSTTQSWTLPWVPGRRMPDVPVWVLTSQAVTFSAAEELTYNLQTRGRAVVVGERTRGGAHPGISHSLSDELEVFVPQARAINPVRGDNWEDRGIEPDIAVPAAEAFRTAYAEALRKVAETARSQAGEAWEALAAEAEATLQGL
jgi:C-terminal processing protease CtpA/Prc